MIHDQWLNLKETDKKQQQNRLDSAQMWTALSRLKGAIEIARGASD